MTSDEREPRSGAGVARIGGRDQRRGDRRCDDLRDRGGEVPDAHRRRHRAARQHRVGDRPIGGGERAPRATRRNRGGERDRYVRPRARTRRRRARLRRRRC